jgi:hypothetical protein
MAAHRAHRIGSRVAQAGGHNRDALVDADGCALLGECTAYGRNIDAERLVGQRPRFLDLAQQVGFRLAKGRQYAKPTRLTDGSDKTRLSGPLHRPHQNGVANLQHVAQNCVEHRLTVLLESSVLHQRLWDGPICPIFAAICRHTMLLQ